jgi:hypothetical protein
MAKPLEMLTASEIKKAYDKSLALCLTNNKALISAGRGMERGSETRAKADPLALEYIRLNDAFNAINDEIRARKLYHGGMQRIIRKAA